jgi:glutamate-5-semialdehyde dehydrogenase
MSSMTTDSTFPPNPDAMAVVESVYQASLLMAQTSSQQRTRALEEMAKSLKQASDDILEANTLDLEASREMAVPDLILEWLKLTPERIQTTVQILQRLAELSDPMRRVMNASYQVEGSQSYCQLMPLGVISLVYEALPDLGAIAAGLCIKTGNCLILKGGMYGAHTNAAIADALQRALLKVEMPEGCLEMIPAETGVSTRDLVRQDKYISLVIPYGRPSLVQQVIRQATVPVLKSGMGNCYLYWSPSGSMDLARWMIQDSHQSEPDPVNAIEKVLIHRNQKPSSLAMLFNSLQDKGFEVRVDDILSEEFPELKKVEESEWSSAYLTKTVAFKVVDNLEAAIAWINHYSSGHADCIVTESYLESSQFGGGVNSASTYINASPRFYRYPKQGDAIFLGMSNQKGHRRGLIGLESLTTVKHIIQGKGQV